MEKRFYKKSTRVSNRLIAVNYLPDSKRSNSRSDIEVLNKFLPMSKRSQARVITAILLILIALVAVVIIWNIVTGLIGDKSSNIDADLLIVSLEIKEIILYPTGSSSVEIHRGSDKSDIDKLKFVFYDADGKSASEDIEEALDVLETKTYSFSAFPSIGKIEKVSVFPMVGDNIGREFSSTEKGILEIPDGLVSWYEFDDSSDSAGNNPGNLIGTNIVDGELVLDGNGYFSASDSESLDLTEGLSISAWIKTDFSEGEIISKGENYKLFLIPEKKIKFSFSSGGNPDFRESYEDVLDNEWNNIALSFENNEIFKMFVNGEPVNDFENLNLVLDVNDNELIIGQGFKGRIDDVMIFNKSISVSQIKGIYQYGLK